MRYPFICFAVLIQSGAYADNTQESDLSMQSDVERNCVFGRFEALGGTGLDIQNTPTGAIVTIGSIVDPETAELQPFALNLSLNVSCNFAHQVSIRSMKGGLLNSDANETSQFANRADYSVTASWGNQQAVYSTTGTSGEGIGLDVGGLFAGRFDLSLNSSSSDLPLVSGDYDDQIILEISGSI